jgi:hypothetical protein
MNPRTKRFLTNRHDMTALARLTGSALTTYTLSEQYTHLVESPSAFRPVIAERMCRLVSASPSAVPN